MAAAQGSIYLNGSFVPRADASLDIEDRGALFADGVYEVLRYYNGRPLAMDLHIERLRRSLAGVRMAEPADLARFSDITSELIARNGLRESKVYWQITRGVAPRDHIFRPNSPATPTILMIAYPAEAMDFRQPPKTIRAILHEDHRWSQCWIKALALLPNVLAKSLAAERGAQEAILHRGRSVTECTAASLFVARHGELWTHPADQWVLPGITRRILIDAARAAGVTVREQVFTIEDLLNSDEIIVTGTTAHVCAVTHIDDRQLTASPGPMTRRLHDMLAARVRAECGV